MTLVVRVIGAAPLAVDVAISLVNTSGLERFITGLASLGDTSIVMNADLASTVDGIRNCQVVNGRCEAVVQAVPVGVEAKQPIAHGSVR